jgi:acetyl-CoA C-acetyltransferase
MNRPVYVVDGCRTPFLKALGKPNPWSAAELAVQAGKTLLLRQPFDKSQIEEVIIGCVSPAADEPNLSRIIALRLGLGNHVLGWTVQRNCASGLQAIECGALDIAHGRHHLVLVGGAESMSRLPLLFSNDFLLYLANLREARGFSNKLKALAHFKMNFLKPVVALLKGLNDPLINLSMGQTAEILAYQFGISRTEMDAYALLSHQKALYARELGYSDDMITLYDWQGEKVEEDQGLRVDSSLEKLAKLNPVFDKPFGNVTAGNSSQISDGAALLILASEEAVKTHRLPVLGKILSTTWAALDPALMGLGPAHAIAKLLQKERMTIADIDYWEINEAFAAQVIACQRALLDPDYCKEALHLNDCLGEIPMEKLNVAGGAIALGHPVGASGARLILNLLRTLKQNQAKRGMASLCIGGGQGGAMLVETV